MTKWSKERWNSRVRGAKDVAAHGALQFVKLRADMPSKQELQQLGIELLKVIYNIILYLMKARYICNQHYQAVLVYQIESCKATTK